MQKQILHPFFNFSQEIYFQGHLQDLNKDIKVILLKKLNLTLEITVTFKSEQTNEFIIFLSMIVDISFDNISVVCKCDLKAVYFVR